MLHNIRRALYYIMLPPSPASSTPCLVHSVMTTPPSSLNTVSRSLCDDHRNEDQDQLLLLQRGTEPPPICDRFCCRF
ncbi:hypothetical protein RRG08_008242 [Elysia crispata]|uniref:Uncharacterized protein n=1 Tax=Elysia crispata TaxID=231223 RepID=A0AAE0YBR4_9GAST|nr:hypothetical protein RRG08_008242 [Elysia crispata]